MPLAAMNLPPLRGTHESLVRQNERAEQDGILRVKDNDDLATLRRAGKLVALPELASMHVDSRLPGKPPILPCLDRQLPRRSRPRALPALSQAPAGKLGRPHRRVSAPSAAYQRKRRARRRRRCIAAPHRRSGGYRKEGPQPSEVAWMRAYLLPLQTAGKIDVEEEFHQSCFHISVYKSYMTPHKAFAEVPHSSALLASGIR